MVNVLQVRKTVQSGPLNTNGTPKNLRHLRKTSVMKNTRQSGKGKGERNSQETEKFEEHNKTQGK